MKCFKCGAELTDDTKFCSYCGAKIEPQVEPEPIADDISETEPVIESTSASASSSVNKEKKSLGDQSKENAAALWSKLTLYGKITTIAIAIFSVMCLVAFMAGKTFAGIIAIIAVALVIVALLIKKQVIKTPRSWLYIVALILAIVLVVPYASVFRVDNGNAEKFKWSDIVLSDVVPEPTSLFGEIISNTDTYLSVHIYKTSKADYGSYIEACKSNGFTVDANESSNSFSAYNVSGYTVSLYYNESDSKMHITVNAAKEYGALVWPESEMASMIPIPASTTGEISKDDETGFHAYVSNTSIDEFKSYIASCDDMGFTIVANDTDKTYSAKNSEGFTLSVEYQGNNVISISVDMPEYEVTIKVECVENWVFSKYDVDILIDDQKEVTHKHGTDADYVLRLKAGKHTITFAEAGSSSVNGSATFDVSGDMEASYKIACYNDKVTVEPLNNDGGISPSDNAPATMEPSTQPSPEPSASSDGEEIDLEAINATNSADSDKQFVGKTYLIKGVVGDAIPSDDDFDALISIYPNIMAKGMGNTQSLELCIWLSDEHFNLIGGELSPGNEVEITATLIDISRNATSTDAAIKGYPIELEFNASKAVLVAEGDLISQAPDTAKYPSGISAWDGDCFR